MQCFVYKSALRADTYVYFAKRDNFGVLPEALRLQLGQLSFVMEIALTPERRLARADAVVVIANLAESGFYLQLPPQLETCN